jgi:hypothetical protein
LTIAGLMVMILLIGIALGALRRPSYLAAAFLFSAALVILTTSILGVLYTRGSARAFWSGFAIGGWMYLLLHYGPFCDTAIGPYTFSTAVLDVLYDRFGPSTMPVLEAPRTLALPAVEEAPTSVMPSGTVGGFVALPPSPVPSAWEAWTDVDWGAVWGGTRAPSSVFRIGHSLLCLVAGLAAGLLARRWALRGREEPNR